MPMATKREQRKYQRKWMANRRKSWIDKNGPCNKCGSDKNLEIDHIDPEQKSVPVGNIWSRRKEIRDKELSKCQVLCHQCHVKKTLSERDDLVDKIEYKMRSGFQKLTEPDVKEIKMRLRDGETQTSIAKDFEVAISTISRINTGKHWNDIKI